ncbi:DUF4177 domain-containing protein [Clostridium tagluense]|uniref:DUF4177 domain-containing protein n=1 Tax=Clostridium tagluense TaxID=360422 RepID=UPI001CF138E9|nr:DUF4177 domain-containing protein [Clostridium tagluense]MCB2318285.1 DUF4177 domain-containing protein [Clostridium tagluense]MCB2323086.1 DUF4177 domain-containing protein [Clostridium tagluense]MCB2328069.1 DUF4177 domain-containing protein [Clostridium tagluense]MCB2337713.1 DUF4177 domain-containing protein [Clostridium tagluense]WAG51386.1 DUF4177 domain-containing protein [Clostridium tagluense]
MDVLETWEYTSFKVESKGFMGGIVDISHFDNELNNFGEQGWELVSCFSSTQDGGKCREIVAVFKRKK